VYKYFVILQQKGEVNHSPREGSKKDLMDLQKLFQELNFNVVTHEDLPNQQFLKELDKSTISKILSTTNSSIVDINNVLMVSAIGFQ